MEILKKLSQQKIAFLSFILLAFMGLTAMYAPMVANNKPFMIYTKNRLLYSDYLDNAQGTLSTVIQQLEQKKRLKNSQLEWLDELLDNVAAFISDKKTKKTLEELPLKKLVLSNDIESLNKLMKLLISLEESKLKKRLFFPLFSSLGFNEWFFMLLLPFYLLFCFLKKLVKKMSSQDYLGMWEKIGMTLILSLGFALVFSLNGTTYNNGYQYKKMIHQFEEGEWAVFPLVPYGENENIISESKQAPTFLLSEQEEAERQHFHLLGTDTNGRDVLARMIYGARISMSIGFVSVGIYVLIGIFIGAIAGFYGGWIDIGISRLMEIVICFPVFFLILIVMAFLQPSIFNIMVIIGLTGWTGIARLMRGEFLRLRGQEFVLAVRALGASDLRIIFRHILPNGLAPIIISATFGIAGAILTESALSFLGFGVPQPTASWGNILNNGRNDIYGSWWLTVFPGIAIFLTVTAFNLIGETLRDLMDPKRRGARA